MALLRYPGSKERITGRILDLFPDKLYRPMFDLSGSSLEYREPFFGAGAVGLMMLDASPYGDMPVWLNDIDPGMAALWTSVRDHSEELIDRIRSYSPTPERAAQDFYEFQENDGKQELPTVERAFQKLVLHMTSFSGLGFKAGGPIGGKREKQSEAKYKADCRWSTRSIVKDIKKWESVLGKFRNFKFTDIDFGGVVAGAGPDCFIYVDPPYVEVGAKLYKYSMSEEDHVRLAASLRDTEASWVLSYDDHELVRDLYSWADIQSVGIIYTMANYAGSPERRPRNSEVIITPKLGQQVGAA